ncbi:NAD(P)/FAD-dependent oxidoreductase [Dactylosporangium sp. NPDC005572]|uniref:FAD-dependent oxidoreductase n=1 Tax=Dactylosporangium sp. NPDC005572 TaxID=3156889 RepID=UPI0033AAAC27
MRAVVIGGGVAGPVAALALRRVGWDVTVYEAYADPAGDVGSFVSLGANGLRALAAVGARDAVAARGTAIPLLRLWSGRGRLLGEAARERVTLMRGHLVETLRDLAVAAGAEVVTGRRLVDVRDDRAVLDDGTRDSADLVVGADGIRSRLRTIVDPQAATPVYAGLWSVGGRSTHPVEPGAFNLTFGAKATFVHAAAAHGTLWTAQFPAPAAPARPPTAEELIAAFAGDRSPAARVIERTDQWHPFTVFRQLPATPAVHRGALVLIGDAAHPIGAGQGASLAIEDAVVLAKCLRDGQTLEAFAALRAPRTARMLRTAGANVDAKVAGPLAARVRDVMMPLLFRRFAAKGSAWMYDYDVEWATPAQP